MLLTSFIAGFLGSLSPCVYPLIPITLSVMGIHKHDSHWHGFRIAASYVAGIVVLHTVLGSVFAYVGVLAGSSLQSPWVDLVLAVLMFVLALNLMGVFTWAIPARLSQLLTHVGTTRGHQSAFLMGLVAGVIAIPCTGPILAAILTKIAEKRDLVKGVEMMVAYSIGMGLPFLILGTFSTSLSQIPKSGPWMNRIKMLLGVVMIYLSFNYAALAWNAWKTPVHREDAISVKVERAHARGKKVILDFWADWCTLCHKLDEKTFGNKRLQQALGEYEVIRVDVTQNSDENRELQERFGVVGLPTLVFVESGEKLSGFIEPDELIQHLKLLAE
jgi:thiol:disulfide interchange protein DsbD